MDKSLSPKLDKIVSNILIIYQTILLDRDISDPGDFLKTCKKVKVTKVKSLHISPHSRIAFNIIMRERNIGSLLKDRQILKLMEKNLYW